MHSRRLSRAVRRSGRRPNVSAGRAGLAIRGQPRPRRRAHSGRGSPWPQPGGRLPTPRPHRALLRGGGGACCAVGRAGGGGPCGRGRSASPIASAWGAREGPCGCVRSSRGSLLTISAMRRRTSASVRGGRSARGGAVPAGSVSCRSPPWAASRVYTVRSSMAPRFTQWTAAGRRPGGGATVPRAALTTAHAASACVWARKVRYPWFSPPWKASATPSAPSSHIKRSARWQRDHPVGRRRICKTVGGSTARGR